MALAWPFLEEDKAPVIGVMLFFVGFFGVLFAWASIEYLMAEGRDLAARLERLESRDYHRLLNNDDDEDEDEDEDEEEV